jgi:hypothetical protein
MKVITSDERLRAFGVLGAHATQFVMEEVEANIFHGQIDFSTGTSIRWQATLETRERILRVREIRVEEGSLFAIPRWRWELRLRLFVDEEIYDDPDVVVTQVVDCDGVREVKGRVRYLTASRGLRDTGWMATGRGEGNRLAWTVRSGVNDPVLYQKIRDKLDRQCREVVV